MFDPAVFEELVALARRAAGEPVELASGEQKAEALRALATARDVLDGAMARGLADVESSGTYADQGAPTVTVWAQQHLRLDRRSARTLVAAGRTLRDLPEVAEAARDGSIRLQHLAAFAAAITRLGAETVADAQTWLLDVARTCDPGELRQVVDRLAEVVVPDSLDAAYESGMDKRDVSLARTTGGYYLSGFLDVLTGTKMATWLSSVAAPRDADDERSASERRVAAVHDLVDSVLRHGMPMDRGVRPLLDVVVDAGALAGDPGAEPAELRTFGPIGPRLLNLLGCDGGARRIDVDGTTDGPTPQARVLDVGRARRLATPAQRAAVIHRQDGTCATPGCRGTHLEVHHVLWWGRDAGRTDLDNLVGLCGGRCHPLVHLGRLVITADGRGGWTFTSRPPSGPARRLDDHARRQRHAVRRRLRALRRAVAEPVPTPIRT